jgi:hypothetical protein
MSRARLLAASFTLALWPQSGSAQQATALFASDAPLRITLQGPHDLIARNREGNQTRPGSLTVDGQPLPVALAPRGITRRASDICDFPPLRVEFPDAAATAASPFAGQRRLKLVTHCKRAEAHQQHVLLEYAAYRIYNLLTPLSFRARLAQIEYRLADGRPMATRWGFFIEDIDDVGRRNGFVHPRTADTVPASTLSSRDAARAVLFEYMIGNLDFSMRAGPEGEGCCHNFRLLQKGANPALVPVPYDFDFSGFVGAPYATPPAEMRVASVRERKYRGYCAHNPQALEAAAMLRSRRPEITAMLATIPGLSPATLARASRYLDGFWAQIASDDAVRSSILKGCAG